MAHSKQNNRRPVTQRGATALAAAESNLASVKQGLIAVGVSEADIPYHRLYVDAATVLNYIKDAIEHFDNPMAAAAVSQRAPKQPPAEKLPKAMVPLKVGQSIIGEAKMDWTQSGFTFIEVTHVVLEDGSCEEISGSAADIFLHRKSIPDIGVRDAISQGVEVVCVIVEGRKAGQLAAADISILPAAEEDVTEESVEGPMAEALKPLTEAEEGDSSCVISFASRGGKRKA